MSKRLKQIYALTLAGTLCIQPIYAQSRMQSSETVEVNPVVAVERVSTSVKPFAGAVHTYTSSNDAFVRDGSHKDSSFGADKELLVKQTLGQDTGYNRKSYVHFDAQGLTGKYVHNVTFKIYLNKVMSPTASRGTDVVSIYAVDKIDQSTVTWNNAPAAVEKVTDVAVERAKTQRYIEVDVTDYINSELALGKSLNDITFALQIEGDNRDDNCGLHFASSEEVGKEPQLVITEGVPVPKVMIQGIKEDMKVTGESVEIQVTATTIDPAITTSIKVEANGQVVAETSGKYTVPLQVGGNEVKITVTDTAGNEVIYTYQVNCVQVQDSVVYYIDSQNGSDTADGLTPETAFKTLDKLNTRVFMPGNTIKFKKGGVWNGQFRPQGSGVEGHPIVVDTYGEGARPIINGNGISNKETGHIIAEGAVHLYNVDNWEINGLEITNTGTVTDKETNRAGIMVYAGGAGIMENIRINDCYVRNVETDCAGQKLSGGILVIGDTRDEKGTETGVHTGFNNVVVENCHIKDVAIEGLRTKTYAKGGNTPTGDRRNQNIVFRNNLIEGIHGDGIVISEVSEGARVEKNIIRDHSMCPKDLNYAGCWVWNGKDVMLEYNEVYDAGYGFMDGEAFDIDIGCEGVTYQYNYSHDNIGGACLFMNGLKTGNVFRYNVSKNDGHGTEIFHYLPGHANEAADIYNNTIYIGAGTDVKYLLHQTVGGRKYPWANFYNNIVQVDGNLQNFSGDRNGNTSEPARGIYKNNIMFPAKFANLPGSPLVHENLITEDPKLINPAAPDERMDTWTQSIWDKNLAKFQIAQDSPAINAGVNVANNGGRDLYGNPLYSCGQADIGAHEVIVKTTNPQVTIDTRVEAIAGKPFEVKVGIDHVSEAVYAQDMVVNFDPAVMIFDGAEGIGQTEVIETQVEEGKVRIILAVPGGITSGNQVVTLKFTPVRNENQVVTTLALSNITLGTIANDNSQVVEAEGAVAAVTVKPASQGVDKVALNNAITEAQNLSQGAVVGDQIGQYPQSAKDALDAAIVVAQGVAQTSEDQVTIDAATATLRTAINTFKAAQVRPAKEDINADGVVNVADLALVAFYYHESEATSSNWNEAKKADVNGDKVVDILDLGLVAQEILK